MEQIIMKACTALMDRKSAVSRLLPTVLSYCTRYPCDTAPT
jgi:hypothetical protein